MPKSDHWKWVVGQNENTDNSVQIGTKLIGWNHLIFHLVLKFREKFIWRNPSTKKISRFWYEAPNNVWVGRVHLTTRLKPKEQGLCLWMKLFPNNHKTEYSRDLYSNVVASQFDRILKLDLKYFQSKSKVKLEVKD